MCWSVLLAMRVSICIQCRHVLVCAFGDESVYMYTICVGLLLTMRVSTYIQCWHVFDCAFGDELLYVYCTICISVGLLLTMSVSIYILYRHVFDCAFGDECMRVEWRVKPDCGRLRSQQLHCHVYIWFTAAGRRSVTWIGGAKWGKVDNNR